jgi:hypothetical protein
VEIGSTVRLRLSDFFESSVGNALCARFWKRFRVRRSMEKLDFSNDYDVVFHHNGTGTFEDFSYRPGVPTQTIPFAGFC